MHNWKLIFTWQAILSDNDWTSPTSAEGVVKPSLSGNPILRNKPKHVTLLIMTITQIYTMLFHCFSYQYINIWMQIDNINLYTQFMSGVQTGLIYHCYGRPGSLSRQVISCVGQTDHRLPWGMISTWLLMPWLLASPGHQQPWYWLCRICRSLSYSRRNFNYLCLISVEEWHKM